MKAVIEKIRSLTKEIGRPVRLMEVCGTHTVAIFRHGIRDLLPEEIMLLSGPGCPVCVTSVRDVDAAVAVSKENNTILTTFGDMMRVPGSRRSLFHAKAEGSDIRIVYSPLDALKLASEHPDKKIVFFATGFETTSPSIAGTLAEAEKRGVCNFYIYSVHKTVPPALKALLDSPDVNVDGFILPGHVSTIIGSRPYGFIARKYGKPAVITGFDAADILSGISMLLDQVVSDKPGIAIQYTKVVREEGNPRAVSLIDQFFAPADAEWRGIGVISESGLELRPEYRHRDIGTVLDIQVPQAAHTSSCSCGDVLRGVKTPPDCALFGKACTPEKPVGPCMVSSEGSCAAYYKYQAVRS